jgi:hypothetical protein
MPEAPDPYAGGEPQSDNLRQVREWGEANDRRAREEAAAKEAALARVQELEAKEQEREVQARVKEAGLTEEQMASLLELNPNPSVEAIDKFKDAFITNALPKDDDNQPEDLMPDTAPNKPTAPPKPISGGTPSSKPYTTDDFRQAALRGDEAALRQMAAAVAKDPSRLKLNNPDKIPVDN